MLMAAGVTLLFSTSGHMLVIAGVLWVLLHLSG